jgi:hypothetical protein
LDEKRRLTEYLQLKRQDLVKNVIDGNPPIFGYPLISVKLESNDEIMETRKMLSQLVLGTNVKFSGIKTLIDCNRKHEQLYEGL